MINSTETTNCESFCHPYHEKNGSLNTEGSFCCFLISHVLIMMNFPKRPFDDVTVKQCLLKTALHIFPKQEFKSEEMIFKFSIYYLSVYFQYIQINFWWIPWPVRGVSQVPILYFWQWRVCQSHDIYLLVIEWPETESAGRLSHIMQGKKE